MKGIIMQEDSIGGILDGRKTETRRIIKPQPIIDQESGYVYTGKHTNLYKNDMQHQPWQERFVENCRLQPGDIVYVKEPYYYVDFCGEDNGYVYKYTENGKAWAEWAKKWKWNSPLFMPEAAARIFLEITSVKVERVADISQEGAEREGMFPRPHRHPGWQNECHSFRDCYSCAYRMAWIKIHTQPKPVLVQGKKTGYISYPFDNENAAGFSDTYNGLPLTIIVNPLVYVITFKKYKRENLQ